MTNFEYERLHHNLKLLKLGTFESVLDNYLEIAAKEKKSTIEILDYLVDREERGLARSAWCGKDPSCHRLRN